MTTTIQTSYQSHVEVDAEWGAGWDTDTLKDWLGDGWSLTDRRRYPRRVVGFKSASRWIMASTLGIAMEYGDPIIRLHESEPPKACTSYAVHLAVHPEFALYRMQPEVMYVGVMEASGQNHVAWAKNSMKYYGHQYHLVARLTGKTHSNYSDRVHDLVHWTRRTRAQLLSVVGLE